MGVDGGIDYSRYSRAALEDALGRIDRTRHLAADAAHSGALSSGAAQEPRDRRE